MATGLISLALHDNKENIPPFSPKQASSSISGSSVIVPRPPVSNIGKKRRARSRTPLEDITNLMNQLPIIQSNMSVVGHRTLISHSPSPSRKVICTKRRAVASVDSSSFKKTHLANPCRNFR
ncbi:hypothetical protein Tsubulata_011867 [Turnera subulata]|uniref:Uncharacterized protein n=1 Tax=Turnera subulata TaxID=218843 RepID=A0A9Q0GBB4_9ROSI|nr:hypothetical protein Tsubulata_011867 [Turnera subulata]